MIYFDNAATTKPYPETVKTYADLSLGLLGNSSAANGLGTVCAEYLEKARQQIQNSLHASGFELYFTSGATESNNEAILGYARRHKKEGKRVITSQGEHASVLNVFEELEKEGFEVIYLPLASDGSLPLTELEQAVNQETILVSLMWVNNEIGTIYPIADFASYVHAHSSAAFMSDLTQALGKTAIDFSCLDFFTMSGHKVGGLKSSGLLGVRQGLVLDPIFYGGGQEGGERPGTVNVPLACSLATALRINSATQPAREKKASALYAYLFKELSQLKEDVKVLSGTGASQCPFILNFALLRQKASVVVEALSKKEIYVSTRSACSSHSKGGSTVIKAMGYPEDIYQNAIRLSFEGSEDIEQGEQFIKALKELLLTLKERS